MKAGRLSSGMEHVLQLTFQAAVGHGHPCKTVLSRRRVTTTHGVNRRKVILLRGGGGVLPVSLGQAGGVTIVKRGTLGVVAMNNNDSSLGMRCRYSPLSKVGQEVNSKVRVDCTHKCMKSAKKRFSNISSKRGLGSSHSTERLVRRTMHVTRSTSCMVFVKKLGGDKRRSYRSASHGNLRLPCGRSGIVKTLTGMGGGLVMIGVSKGTMTVP